MKKGFTPLENVSERIGGEYQGETAGLKPTSSITVRRRSSLTGFTLLELLIGITIFAILASAVYASFYLGIKVYKQSEKSDQLSQEAVMALEHIAKKLRCAFLNPKNEEIKFVGTEKTIDFYCVNKEEKLEKIGFYLEPSAGGGLFSLYQSKMEIAGFDEENTGSPVVELINSKISLFKISYFNGSENKWEDEWEGDTGLPVQVKLEAGFGVLSNGRPFLCLEKYVNIPAAIKINFEEGEKL